MSNMELFNQAIARYKATTCKNGFNFDEVISFLENEIQQYRETIKNLESYVEDLNHKNEILSYDVEKGKNHINLLRDRVKELTDANTIIEKTRNDTIAEIIKALSENGYTTIVMNCHKNDF